MFREFNVKFEDVEMLGGADNLLEGTEITKVIVRGDNNKMSSLDSMLKNCNELDTVEGELDLNGVSDIDNLLEGTELVKSIDLKNINNENISANNSFPHVDRINIGGELYNKKAMQNVIASKDWTFDNINYQGTVGDNIVTKEVNIVDDNKATIKDTLEQKAKGIEIVGQTYENLVVGSREATLLDELTLESVDGNSKEFNPHLEQPVCVEVIEGETYQNLIDGKGEYKLTDTFSTTWTESNNSIENPPSMIEIPEIWGNTMQGYANVVTAKQVVDCINNSIDGTNSALKSDETFTTSVSNLPSKPANADNFIQLKANTVYSLRCYRFNSDQIVSVDICLGNDPSRNINVRSGGTFTTDSSGKILFYPNSVQNGTLYLRCVEGQVDLSQYAYDEMDLNYIQSVGDLYVDEEGSPILDEEGNEQYKLEIESTDGLIVSSKESFPIKLNGSEVYTSLEGFEGMKANQEYYCYCIFSDGTYPNQTMIQIHFFDKNGKKIGSDFNLNNPNGINTFTPSADVYSIKLRVWINIPTDKTISNVIISSQKLDINYVIENRDTLTYQSNKTTILMPQPLRKITSTRGDNKIDKIDRLYWDSSKGKYIIEQNIKMYNIGIAKDNGWGNVGINFPSDMPNSHNDYDSYPFILEGFKNVGWNSRNSVQNNYAVSRYVSDNYILVFPSTLTMEEKISLLSNKNVYYWVDEPQYIETKILEKPSLETYSPKTYISANTEIQPSQMTVTNKRNLIDLKKMKANTDYTVQLKCNEKGNKPIKFNLCGKEKDIDATIGVNHVNITTNELNDNKLELSGEGNVVSEIIVAEGEMNQYPSYFNGVQSVGELQDDGTYKIDILTNEGFNISIISNNPLAKGDKLYWNKSNKRYEIDRGGSVEVPSVEGDVIDLPRLYQREDTHFSTSTGNIKPSKIKLDYNDLD